MRTGMTTSGTTTQWPPSGTARDRFQPASQHATNLIARRVELLVDLVGKTATIFTKI